MSDTQGKFYKKLYGKIGEKKAEKYLVKKGYVLLERNYKTKFAEADLIFDDAGTIVFVEVKARSSDDFGEPSQAVDYKKQRKYVKLAEYYLVTKGVDKNVRFDVIEVKKGEINHIKDAFYA